MHASGYPCPAGHVRLSHEVDRYVRDGTVVTLKVRCDDCCAVYLIEL